MPSRKTSSRPTPTRDEALQVFNYIWKELRIRQRQIAQDTGVDQGSVSKILRGVFSDLAPGARAYRVWKYANEKAGAAGFKLGQPSSEALEPRLAAKLNRVWDRTPEGADALLKLLDAAQLIQQRRDERPKGGK